MDKGSKDTLEILFENSFAWKNNFQQFPDPYI